MSNPQLVHRTVSVLWPFVEIEARRVRMTSESQTNPMGGLLFALRPQNPYCPCDYCYCCFGYRSSGLSGQALQSDGFSTHSKNASVQNRQRIQVRVLRVSFYFVKLFFVFFFELFVLVLPVFVKLFDLPGQLVLLFSVNQKSRINGQGPVEARRSVALSREKIVAYGASTVANSSQGFATATRIVQA
jgi:hypothetical protein